MNQLAKALPPLPARIARLPVDERGFPVPWFVAWPDGKPDFRMVESHKIPLALKAKRCWICGDALGAHLTFPIGPMCAVNRVTSEPPSHLECAEFAVKACPFLTQPRMRRNEKNLPEERQDAPGIHLDRNPGAVCLWITKTFKTERVGTGVLFFLGEPSQTLWYTGGRLATREEIKRALQEGLPALERIAEIEGPPAVAELKACIERVQPLLPS
jgi:hypothetical protein